jgi:hypothetical protein
MSIIKNPVLFEGKPLNYLGGVFCLPETETGGGYYTEYQVVYDAFNTKPAAAVATAQNAMVKTLVDNSIWTGKFDVFYVFANDASDNALINWVKPGTYNCANIHNTAFTALEGFTGDGANDVLNTQWNPTTNAVNFLKDNCSFGVYQRIDKDEFTRVMATDDGVNECRLTTRNGGSFYLQINAQTSAYRLVSDSLGLFVGARDSSIIQRFYHKGAEVTPLSSDESTVLPNANFYILGASPGASVKSTNQVSLAFTGGLLTTADVSILNTAIETYMDSNGKGVE